MLTEITPIKALALFLNGWKASVITKYQIGLFFFTLYTTRKYNKQSIHLERELASIKDYNAFVDQALNSGILIENRNFPPLTVFDLLGTKDKTPEEIICTVDPFAYISHLSAMDFYGLTDRIPNVIFISRPRYQTWINLARTKMKSDLDNKFELYQQFKLPQLMWQNFNQIDNRRVKSFNSTHLGAFKNISKQNIRVAKIGRTFLDMLRNPELCGGIEHVLDVFEEHANSYFNLIVEEIDRNGKPIDKIRAGYILEEVMGLKDDRFNEWLKLAKKGGSRKLDPTEDYCSNYSEKWCLSINTIRDRS